MRTFNKQLASAQPLNANYTSPAIPLKNIYMYSIAAVITGTPTGGIKLQVSNDPETNDTAPSDNPQPPPVNWCDLADSTFSLTASGETMWNVRDVAYNWVRLVYTDGSGGTSSATMKLIVNSKGV